ncbi:MAG: SDR family NAD(P)-dependent oxidoreductase [Novosphingobium sp.]|nr:SDR family NAD(P)-dependent oxidoreductase [Novosphingobium sp.]
MTLANPLLARWKGRQVLTSESRPRVAVVTGASSGIGKATAEALAAQGFRIIAHGRDAGRCASAEADIRKSSTSGDVTMLRADLSLMADAARLADEITGLTDRVDVLVNNAGGMASELVLTSEGNDANFAGNHLGPFLLTNRLLPLLRRAAQDAPAGSVRIVNTSSDASEMIEGIDFDDMQQLGDWSSGYAYCGSKLANVLHAHALAGMLASDGIIAHSVHPGTADSNFFSTMGEETRRYADTLDKITNEEGADTVVWLATAEEPGQCSGLYWHKRELRTPNPLVDDADYIARFWTASEELANQVNTV